VEGTIKGGLLPTFYGARKKLERGSKGYLRGTLRGVQNAQTLKKRPSPMRE